MHNRYAAQSMVSLLQHSTLYCVLLYSRHTLSDAEKKAYIDAELCLFNLPAKEGYPGAVNRFDDLHFSHINSTNVVHDVVSFFWMFRLDLSLTST